MIAGAVMVLFWGIVALIGAMAAFAFIIMVRP